MKIICLIYLFISQSLIAQEDLSVFLPVDHNATEKEILENFRDIKIEPNLEKLYSRKNWVFPIYYDTINDVCKSTCYYNGEVHQLVGQKVITDLASYYFGVLTKNDSIVNTARWEEKKHTASTEKSSHLRINLIFPKSSGGITISVKHMSDSICYFNDELRIFSEKHNKIRRKIQSYYKENPINPNPNPFTDYNNEHFYSGDTSAIYWVEVGENTWGELLIGSDRHDISGERVNGKLIFNVYNEIRQTIGVISLVEINPENKTLVFRDNCLLLINENIHKKEKSSINAVFGNVHLPSQNIGGFGSSSDR